MWPAAGARFFLSAITCNRFHSYATGSLFGAGSCTYVGEVVGRLNFTCAVFKSRPSNTQAAEPAGTGEFRFTAATASQEFFGCSDEKTIQFSIERFKPFAGKSFHLLSSAQRDRRGRCPM